MRRRPAVLIMGLLIGLLVLLGPATPAGAHATLQDTTPTADALVPEAPGTVELRFDEPVSASTGAVQVIGPGGGRVDGAIDEADGGRTVSVTVDGDAAGTYTVAHRVVSDDGHTITGSYVFHVRTRTGAADVDQSVPLSTSAVGGVGRWLSYAGAIVAVGAALVLAIPHHGGGAGGARGRLAALLIGGAVAGGLGGGLAVLAQTASTTGRGLTGALSLVGDVAADSRPVAMALARASVVLLAAVVAMVGRRRDPVLLAAGAIVALAGLLAPVAGHPWTADPQALAVPADAVHLLAASVWLGMVAALAATGHHLPDPVAVVRRVSAAGLVGAGVVLVSGAVSAVLLLGSVDALFQTASGQLVLLKVIGFLGIVFLGWINRARLIPLLAPGVGAVTSDDQGDDEDGPGRDGGRPRSALAPLLQIVRVEVVVGALILAATAGLVNQPPGHDQLARPFADTRTVAGASLLLEVEPAEAGDNQMHIYLRDAQGQPAPFDAIEVRAGRPGVPERRLNSEQVTPDHAVVYGASLPTAGTWTVDVTTVHLGESRQFRFEVPVR